MHGDTLQKKHGWSGDVLPVTKIWDFISEQDLYFLIGFCFEPTFNIFEFYIFEYCVNCDNSIKFPWIGLTRQLVPQR